MRQKKINGVTIFEVLLVLVIMSFILILSIRQYISFRNDADVQQVQYNVDMLFDAMVGYFRANCNKDEFVKFNDQGVISIPITQLMNEGFLQLPKGQMTLNPIVDGTGSSQGYLLQFNQVQKSDKTLPIRSVGLSSGGTTSMGNISIWEIQISVKLRDTTNAQITRSRLLANCLSNVSGSFVPPCDKASLTDNKYAVFERLPAFASSQYNTQLWVLNPIVKQFTLMYNTYPILILTGGQTPSSNTYTGNQYYYCGSS